MRTLLGVGFTRADLIQYGIGVPKGGVAHNTKEAEKVAKSIGV